MRFKIIGKLQHVGTKQHRSPIFSLAKEGTKGRIVSASVSVAIGLIPISIQPTLALPPPEDTPEEVLRTEIILEARSPVDGKPLSAAEYAQLQAQLQTRRTPPELSPQVRDTIFLLRLRKAILTVLPFLPI